MAIAPLSKDNIKVGYITDDGYVAVCLLLLQMNMKN